MDSGYISTDHHFNNDHDQFDHNGDDNFRTNTTELDEIRITNTILMEKQLIDNELNNLIYSLQSTYNLNQLKSNYENAMMQIEHQYNYELHLLSSNNHEMFGVEHSQILHKYEQDTNFLFNTVRQRIEVGFLCFQIFWS
jgi:hypothetical protein